MGFYHTSGLALSFGAINPHSVYTYYAAYAAAADNIFVARPWIDEVPPMLITTDMPRNLQFRVIAGGGGTCTGTITILGLDAQGAMLTETIIVNNAGAATYTGNKAFALLTSITTDRTDVTIGSMYSGGLGEKVGVPNYPWTIAGRIVKATINGIEYVGTEDLTYGTIDLSPGVIIAPTNVLCYIIKALPT